MQTTALTSYSLTFPQLDVFFHQQQLPDCPLYNICGYTRLAGKVDIPRLQLAYQKLAQAADIFRLYFEHNQEWPEQKLAASCDAHLSRVDFSGRRDPEAEAKAHLEVLFATQFDLSKGPLFTGQLITLSENEHWFVTLGHHLVVDGWATSHIIRKLGEIYTALGQETDEGTWSGILSIPNFVDVVAQEARYQQSASYRKSEQYWLDKFQTIPEHLFTAHYRGSFAADQVVPSKRQHILLSREKSGLLQHFCRQQDTGIQGIFLGLLYSYFSSCYGQSDLVIGTPVHNRTSAAQKQIIGMFASMSPLRLALSRDLTFTELLRAIGKIQRQDFRHQKYPVSHLNRQLKLSRSSQQQLFDLCFNYLKLDINARYDDCETLSRFIGHGFSQIPLSVNLIEFGEQQELELQLDYNLAYFSDEEALLLLNRLDFLLEQVLSDPGQQVSALAHMPPSELTRLQSFTCCEGGLRSEKTAAELFEAFARQHPGNAALVAGQDKLSFAELNQQANQLAHYLTTQGVGVESRVGICTTASVEMIISVLAVFKTGAMYVPLDANFPQARLDYMVQDSQIQHLLTQSQYLPLFQNFPLIFVTLDSSEHQQKISGFSCADLERPAGFTLSCLAYLIYTSGSTGQPKGVMVEHQNLMHYAFGIQDKHQLPPGMSYGVLSSLATDLGNTSLYLAFISGGCLHLLPELATLDSHQFARHIHQQAIDVLKITPNHFDALYDEMLFEQGFPCRFLFLGGEPLIGRVLSKVDKLNREQACQVINHYGPTETTIGCLTHALCREQSYTRVPIGTPLANSRAYVLNQEKKLQPLGCVGELYIGGGGVTRGYLNQAKLTRERFVDGFSGIDSQGPLYQTGDLVRCLTGGEIEFTGRNDDQVKIRGYRVELGEIEARLTRLNDIEVAVVQLQQDDFGARHLVAFVTISAVAGSDIKLKDLRLELAKFLPAHMVPEQLMVLEQFPLMVNGKIDRKALPKLDNQISDDYLAPQGEAETCLVQVCAELLSVPEQELSTGANFFALGGDSIISIQLVSRMRQTGWTLTGKDILDAPRIKDLALLLKPLADKETAAEQGPVEGDLPLLPIQHLFFGDETQLHHYNQSVLLAIPAAFTPEHAKIFVEHLYRRHDALRLAFSAVQGQWQASHQNFDRDMLEQSVEVITLAEEDFSALEEIADRIQASLSLEAGGLFKAAYFINQSGQTRLLLVCHHLIVDGVSWRVILEDLERISAQLEQNQAPALAAKTSSFKAWGEFLQAYAKSEQLLDEREYWLAQGADLPATAPRVEQEVNFTTLNFSLDEQLTERLLHHAGQAYRTQVNELLLAALLKAHCQWSGQLSLTLDLEGHGREIQSTGLDLSQTMGWFTSLYPLKLTTDTLDWRTVITRVKETYRRVPHHGLGFGVLKYLVQDSELAKQPRPELVFNYLGQFDQVVNSGHKFSLLNENKGRSISPKRRPHHNLTLNGMVNNACLHFDLTFDNQHYDSDVMAQLVQTYSEELSCLVTHCLSDNSGWRTLSDFPLAHITTEQLDSWQSSYPIQDLYPATAMQQGLLFHSEQDRSAYATQKLLTLNGSIELVHFRQAWQQLVDDHAVFRTIFVGQDLGMQQLVLTHADLPWFEFDLSHLNEAGQQAEIARFIQEDKQLGFDKTRAPLMRISIWHLGKQTYQLLWSSHHALTDGWCNPLIFSEMMASYQRLCRDQALVASNSRPYRDYIVWLLQQDSDGAQAFWQQELAALEGPTPLPSARDADNSPGCDELSLSLTPEQTGQLSEFARKSQVTLSVVLQGAWAYLLSAYSREKSVVFGTTVSGRPAQINDVDKMIGLFINTIPVRVGLDKEQGLQAWLKDIHQGQHQRESHSFLPLTEIQQASGFAPGTPLFNSLFVFENYPVAALSEHVSGKKDITLSSAQSFETSNYQLTLVAQLEQALTLKLTYLKQAFGPAMAQQLLRHYQEILMAMPTMADKPLSALALLSAQETRNLTRELNSRQESFAANTCLHRVFEQQAAIFSENTALSFAQQQLDYETLNRQANQLARYLRDTGVETETLVGICLDRSVQMLVAILAILKAGGAYVPLDPSNPQERLDYIIEDSGINYLLTDSGQALACDNLSRINLDESDFQAQIRTYPTDNLPALARQDGQNLAYVIYTSGSTGRPKGVLVEHRQVIRLFKASEQHFHFNGDDVWSMCHSYAFDFSVWEIWGALLHGGRLVVIPQRVSRAYDELYQLLIAEKVTVLNQTPSAFSQLSLVDEQVKGELSLRSVIFGGEALNLNSLKPWVARHGDSAPELINMYGITETTVHVTYRRILASDIAENQGSLIGRPIADLSLYLLDEALRPVPVGACGEIFVGGDGVTRGYLNRDELTQERFIINPYNRDERLYRTGDLARFLGNMEMEYLGRIDDQVKIRGFRIELGEIEQQLLNLEQVLSALVCVHGQEQKSLVAYLVLNESACALPQDEVIKPLRQQLSALLPEYMLPSFFVVLEQLPLTTNGKVDKKALPEPDRSQLVQDFIAPVNPIEIKLAKIWGQLLQVAAQEIGINANFFELGGHSLLSLRLVAEIKQSFGVELAIRDIFENARLAQLAQMIADSAGQGTGLQITPVTSQDNRFVLSFAQQRLWFIDAMDGGSAHYNMSGTLDLSGSLDIKALEQAFATIVERHQSLRTCIKRDEQDRPMQQIRPAEGFSLSRVDLSSQDEPEQSQLLEQEITHAATKVFDLQRDFMLRVHLVSLSSQQHVLVVTMHHIASDGWSMSVLIKELSALYSAYRQGEDNPLAMLKLQYTDYAHWQRQYLQGDVLEQQLLYWEQQLADLPVVHGLPLDYPRGEMQTFNGQTLDTSLSRETLSGLKALCREQGATLFMGLHAAFSLLLARYSNETDIVVGSPVANREQAEIADLIGFFVNTLVLRCDLSQQPGFSDLLEQSKQNLLDAYAHQQVPFEQLVERLQPERSLQHSPLFQVMLVLQNNEEQELVLPGLELNMRPGARDIAKYDLTLTVSEKPQGLALAWEYNTDLFQQASIARMAEHFQHLVDAILARPQTNVFKLPLLSKAQAEQALQAARRATVSNEAVCVHEIFQGQVAIAPQAIALELAEQNISYQALNTRANRLARYLMENRQVKPDTLVGICLEPSVDLVVGILAILKAGGAYVPLDPAYPEARLTHMLSDAALETVLTHSHLQTPVTRAQALYLDEESFLTGLGHYCDEDIPVSATGVAPHHLAYVIYTSGSTGLPKGVMISHDNWQAYSRSVSRDYGLKAQEKILQFSSISFDILVEELSLSLLHGNTLVLPPTADVPSVAEFWQRLDKHRVTIATLPTAYWHQLCLDGQLAESLNTTALDLVIVGGEAISARHLGRWQQAAGENIRLLNTYGPTETTVIASYADVSSIASGASMIPIGRASQDSRLLVLDQYLAPVPDGVAGELYIGGEGLARGYLNQAELTEQAFVSLKARDSGEKPLCLYKSGDLVRRLADGNLAFLGRIDHQVKIRGFRIELGEIEHALKAQAQIKDVIVLAKEDDNGNKRLIAYLVSDQALILAQEENNEQRREFIEALRQSLSQRLPEYMVPAGFVLLGALPLTANGKVDKKALPEADMSLGQGTYVAPANDNEVRLAAIWQELLGLERVGVTDNFFDLGGHSLLATQLSAKIRYEFDVEINLAVIFKQQTIRLLAQSLETSKTSQLPKLVKAAQVQEYPLSFAQQGFWLAEQMTGANSAYNMPAAIKLGGEVNQAALKQAYQALVARHDVFRSAFVTNHRGEAVQKIYALDELALEIEVVAVDEQELTAAMQAHATASFDLAKPSLFKLQLLLLTNGEFILLAKLHHIIADGWSVALLIKEFNHLYLAYSRGQVPGLSPLDYQYQDYSVWQHQCFSEPLSESGREMLDYWSAHLSDAPRSLPLAQDFLADDEKPSQRKTGSLMLTREQSEQLQAFARGENATLFSVLLAGLNTLMAKWTGEQDVVIGTVVAGRHQLELASVIGCFINVLTLRTRLNPQLQLIDIVRQTNEVVVNGLANQDLPFDLLVEHINPERTGSQNPFNNVSLRLQNIKEENLSLDGLAMESLEQDLSAGGTQLDLMFEAIERPDGLELVVQYEGKYFSEQTIALLLANYQDILSMMMTEQALSLDGLSLSTSLAEQRQRSQQLFPQFYLAASFTAEPIKEPLMFWGKEFNQALKVDFAPYNQVFQELLNPDSELVNISHGCGAILFRWQDWLGASGDELALNASHFFGALEQALSRTSSPLILMVCPASSALLEDQAFVEQCLALEAKLAQLAQAQPLLELILPADVFEAYPVSQTLDAFMEQEASIPYTPEAYTAMATSLYRRFSCQGRRPYKVIVLDCDNTLWQGVCGEVGALGVEISGPYLALQQFMLEQYHQGVVLCLNSKNNPEDVQQVFDQHPDMLLTMEHIVLAKVNWHAKSENIREIAAELNLGLDSFIFVDDDTMQCAEVRSRVPQVLTLQLPADTGRIEQFLAHSWAFDRVTSSGMGAERSRYYKADQQRQQLQQSHFDLSEFLESLELNIEIRQIEERHIPRASELSLRTNQFNLTTRRHSEGQIRDFIANGQLGWNVSVSDRFGDYGDVGLLLAEADQQSLKVTDFMLSCRAMGRGVEHTMVRHLASVAKRQGLASVDLLYRQSKKNLPALNFLQTLGLEGGGPELESWSLTTAMAEQVNYLQAGGQQDNSAESGAGKSAEKAAGKSANTEAAMPEAVIDYQGIANSLADIQAIQARVDQFALSINRTVGVFAEFVPPVTEAEQKLCQLWQDLLGLEQVGIKDNFFELGGNSLQATRLIAQINETFNIVLLLDQVFKAQSIEMLAGIIEQQLLILSVQSVDDGTLSEDEMELTI
ncbi:non-ribosomal peptide synthetase [Thalassomonas actiniarum]|uniref:Non-ribosomal peptide synthetase n=1 Tax=Thalassomonas actiniarum TaxID=485447 RepID=A0AAF0C2X3_9GAMM|nr:non-ribosomal peptide synthetase [Thalassomonas actiniarum]WDD98094.1 non-ribosomal peptide synthetase [Thalassomonas actiniarum]